jgi:flagellar biosynthesis/type III secretory pathway chaperone
MGDMERMLDNLLKILREEANLFGMMLNLAQDEKDAVTRSDLDALRTATEEKTLLVPRIQELDRKRKAVAEDLAKTMGRPRGLNLREISDLAEEPYATQLEACRSHLSRLAASISDISFRNRELITHRLKFVRSSFFFLNNVTVSSTVYRNTGKMTMTSDRSGRVLSGDF